MDNMCEGHILQEQAQLTHTALKMASTGRLATMGDLRRTQGRLPHQATGGGRIDMLYVLQASPHNPTHSIYKKQRQRS